MREGKSIDRNGIREVYKVWEREGQGAGQKKGGKKGRERGRKDALRREEEQVEWDGRKGGSGGGGVNPEH
jgi:hypothetical protein